MRLTDLFNRKHSKELEIKFTPLISYNLIQYIDRMVNRLSRRDKIKIPTTIKTISCKGANGKCDEVTSILSIDEENCVNIKCLRYQYRDNYQVDRCNCGDLQKREDDNFFKCPYYGKF